jgi:hypothetical protein
MDKRCETFFFLRAIYGAEENGGTEEVVITITV